MTSLSYRNRGIGEILIGVFWGVVTVAKAESGIWFLSLVSAVLVALGVVELLWLPRHWDDMTADNDPMTLTRSWGGAALIALPVGAAVFAAVYLLAVR